MIVAASVATSGESMRRGRSMSHRCDLGDPAGPAREQHDPIAEADRLAHVVRHEQTVLPVVAPQRLELVVEDVARHRVERPERFVHQQHLRVLRERAGQRAALAHAARELVRALLREVGEVHHLEQLLAAVAPALARRAAELQRELDVAAHREPREQRRFLEHRARCGWPVRPLAPTSACRDPATRLSSVLLPQPDAPSRHTNSPGATSRLTPSSATTAPGPCPNTLRTSWIATADATTDPAGGAGSEVASTARSGRMPFISLLPPFRRGP